MRRCWEGLEQNPPKLYFEHFAPDVELANPPEFPLTGPFHGHDGLKQWASEVWEVIADFHNEVEEIIEVGDGNRIVSIQETQGRMRHTELPANFRWGVLWTFDGEQVVRSQGFMTPKQALEAAGLSK